LIDANPAEFKLIDSREVSTEETWAHIAIVGDEIYIRELKALAAYRWK
jgi:predicted metal-dependent phosphoesterase TrpH